MDLKGYDAKGILLDNPAVPCILARPLNPGSASERNIKLMRTWLRHCRQNHVKCRNARKSLRPVETPTRLVYVNGTGDQVRIENNGQEMTGFLCYISYC